MASFRSCSSCRKNIEFSSKYWECSVSTCNRQRTGLYFCSVSCWEAHLPTMRHREAYAIEKIAPTEAEWQAQQEAENKSSSVTASERKVVGVVASAGASASADEEILIVVSKLKKYIRERTGMNTSDDVMPVLSNHLRLLCERAMDVARSEGRKTVLDRDVAAVLRQANF